MRTKVMKMPKTTLTGKIDISNMVFTPGKSYPVHDEKGNVIGECTIDENGIVTSQVPGNYSPLLNQQTSFSIEYNNN